MSFAASVMAKGRGGGSYSISIDDNWDAPGVMKAAMAFEIIWAVFSLVQFIYILKNLSKIPTASARGPYILLAVTTFFTFLYYAMWGVLTRVTWGILDSISGNKLSLAITGIFTVVIAFQPASVLWLLHQRGSVLRTSRENTVSPFSSLLWKRIVDWVLVGITFVIYIAAMAVSVALAVALENNAPGRVYTQYLEASRGLSHTITGLILLICIDIVVTSLVVFFQVKRAQWNDPIIRRLCQVIVPLFAVYGLQWLIFDIYYEVAVSPTFESRYTASLVGIIIEGISRLGITYVLIVTMSLSGVQWVLVGGAPSYLGTSEKPWVASKVDGSQPYSTPQQQPLPLYPHQPYYQQQQQHPYQQQQPYYAQQQSFYSMPSIVTHY